MTGAAAAGGRPGDTPFPSGSISLRLLSDQGLARRGARGDRRAFEAIYRRYERDLYRFCLAMAGSPQDAQDALQNTMVKVLRALPGERRHIELKPWLYRIARNETVELLRRRRDSVELDTNLIAAGGGLAETAETRERLRGLFADLEQLPERQRAALVMREMAGLGFEQIGESFDTSAAVARQTVYEARLSLRQMEEGREMSCDAVTRALSDADGRVARRRDIRAHLRECERCRAFRDGIEERRGELAAIAPLPLALSAGLLQGALGAGKVGAAAGAAGGALAKSAATVAVVAAIGVTAADRGGLVDLPVFGDGNASERKAAPRPEQAAPSQGVGGSGAAATSDSASAKRAGDKAGKPGDGGRGVSGRDDDRGIDRTAVEAGPPATVTQAQTGHGEHRGRPEGLPPASRHGQETAAAKKPPQAVTPPGPGGSGGGAAGGNPPEPPAPSPAPASPPAQGAGPPSSIPAPPPTAAPPAGGQAVPPPAAKGAGKP